MKRKSRVMVAIGCLLVLILLALFVLLKGEKWGKIAASREDSKKKEMTHKSKVNKGSSSKEVFFSRVNVVEVSAGNEDSIVPNKGQGQGRIPFVARIKGIETYFHYVLKQGGKLLLTKGAGFKVKGKIELKNNNDFVLEEGKESALFVGAATVNARDVTYEFTRLFGGPALPFGATRAILVWPAQISKRLQDGLRDTRWSNDATKFYGTIEVKDGHLVITLNRVLKKDGTIEAINYIFKI